MAGGNRARMSSDSNQDQAVWQAALQYLGQGWSVYPVAEASEHLQGMSRVLSGKLPVSLRYFINPIKHIDQATPDQFTGHGIGIATGGQSRLLVIDVDGSEGLESAAQLQHSPTRTVRTRHGLHLYYAYPEPTTWMPSAPGVLAEGIDIKGDDGFVSAPPSRHPEGGYYEWINPEVAIATLPNHLVELIKQLPHRPRWKMYRRYIWQKYLRHPFNALTGI